MKTPISILIIRNSVPVEVEVSNAVRNIGYCDSGVFTLCLEEIEEVNERFNEKDDEPELPERDEPVLSARECDAAANAAWGTRLGQMEGRTM